MKNKLLSSILIATVILLLAYQSYSQWTVDHYSVNAFNGNYFSYITVADSTTVWVVGSTHFTRNNVLRRNSFGNWDSIPTNGISNSLFISCIAAKDNLNAWMTDYTTSGNRGNAHIYRTTNGGINWFIQVNTGGQFGGFNGIAFSKISPAYGYAWSNPPDSNGTPIKIYKTSNNGETWLDFSVIVDPRFAGTQNSICVTDADHVWMGLNNTTGMYDYHKVLYSTNGGANFLVSNLTTLGYGLNAIEFKQNNLFGIAAAEDQYDYLSKSYNGGLSWTFSFSQNLGNSKRIISIPNSNTWYAATSSYNAGERMYKSTDDGVSWFPMSFPDSIFINILYMDGVTYGDKVYLYAVDKGGKIFRLVENVAVIGVHSVSTLLPEVFALQQNYPNPFNPITKVRFTVPNAGNVRISVYDALGKEVRLLVNESLQVGIYETDFDAANTPSGVYFYRMEAGNFSETKKMVVLK